MKSYKLFLLFILGIITRASGQDYPITVECSNPVEWFFTGVIYKMKIEGEDKSFSNYIIHSSDGQQLKPDVNGRFSLKVKRRYLDIKVYKKDNKDSTLVFQKKFNIKPLPKPTAYIIRPTVPAKIAKKEFLEVRGILAELLNYDYDLRVPIQSYTILVLRDNKLIFMKNCLGNRFTSGLKKELEAKLTTGDKILITNVFTDCDYYFEETLNSIQFSIK